MIAAREDAGHNTNLYKKQIQCLLGKGAKKIRISDTSNHANLQ